MFIKTLVVDLGGKILVDEDFLELEEKILDLGKNLEYDFNEKNIVIYNLDYGNNEKISFADYIEEGKNLKNFLIEKGIATNENYKDFFKIEKKGIENYLQEEFEKENEKNEEKILLPSELDAMIAKVDKNDPKLLDVLAKIEKIKK